VQQLRLHDGLQLTPVRSPAMSNKEAAPGKVFVCTACGRRSRDLFGFKRISRSWDESCMANASEVPEDVLVIDQQTGLVTGVKPPEKRGHLVPETWRKP
jgi:hypothetical protein